MNIEPDRLDLARRSTLISYAEGAPLSALCALYGLPFTARTNDSATQRAALRATLYSARGAPAALFSTLRAIMGPFERELTSATLTPAAQGAALTSPELRAGDQGAWLEVDGLIYHAHEASDGAATLTPAASAYHRAAPTTGPAREVSARVLPFRLIERDCEVIISLSEATAPTPPTYMRHAPDPREITEPNGGHILTLTDSDPATSRGSTLTGPHPLYFAGRGISPTLESYLKRLLAAGVRLTMRPL